MNIRTSAQVIVTFEDNEQIFYCGMVDLRTKKAALVDVRTVCTLCENRDDIVKISFAVDEKTPKSQYGAWFTRNNGKIFI